MSEEIIVDEERVQSLLADLIAAFNKYQPNIPEILLAYGNLGYHLGASIAGFKNRSEGPGLDILQKAYYTSPTVDVGLMIQGLLITSWEDSFRRQRKISNLAKQQEPEDNE
jgi:uncharacterized protein YejL (UPF0352 family)